MQTKLSAEQRREEFDKLFDSMPGKKVDKIREICRILHCKEITVRIWLMSSAVATGRAIPESKLRILQDAFAESAPAAP